MASASSCGFWPDDIIDGKYRVERVLGEGGMSTVLAAKNIGTGADVAVKLLHAHYRRVGVIRERFLREGRAASALKSPHAVRIFDVGVDPQGIPYVVMERLTGCDLEQLVGARGAISEDAAIDHLLGACDALAEAHALGIVHRDLKPANLFLARTSDGREMVRVLDFGTATSATLTARDNVATLGAILYRLVSARLHRPNASREIILIVRRCLDKDPSARFADAGELRRALEDARDRSRADSRLGLDATLRAPAPTSVRRAPRRQRHGYMLLVAAVLASLVATFASAERARASAGRPDHVSEVAKIAGQLPPK